MEDKNFSSFKETTRSGLHGVCLAMFACCAVIVVPVFGYFLVYTGAGNGSLNWLSIVPLILCVGAHFMMHKVTGKSCHHDKSETEEKQTASSYKVTSIQHSGSNPKSHGQDLSVGHPDSARH